MSQQENNSRTDQEQEANPETGGTPPPSGRATTSSSPSAAPGGPSPRTEARPDIGRRIIAVIIDVIIAFVLGFIPFIGGLLGALYMLLRDGMHYEIMDRRSVGKKLMRLRPVCLDGGEMDVGRSAKRNWMFALGAVNQTLLWIPIIGWALIPIISVAALIIGIVELVLVLTDQEGRRWGDRIAGTKVIEVLEEG